MSKICFTWELGQGFGHLVRYLTLISALREAGHDIEFLAKEPQRAAGVLEPYDVTVRPLPTVRTSPAKSIPMMNSYPDVIANVGFAVGAQLASHLRATVEAIEETQADLLIIDHSPTTLLANHILNCPAVFSGTGFTVPPRATPMPPLRYWTAKFREELGPREQQVVDAMNQALAQYDIAPLEQFVELFRFDREWLLSFPELDHYVQRSNGRFLGSFPSHEFGLTPQWPAASGPKIFAYLSSSTVNAALWQAFASLDASVCLYAPALPLADRYPDTRIFYAEQPVDLLSAGAQCDIAISNSSLNTVAGFLMSGTPQLVFPTNLERYMVGRRLELLGAGLIVAPRQPDLIPVKLEALHQERSFARAAERFAETHAAATPEQQLSAMVSDIEALL